MGYRVLAIDGGEDKGEFVKSLGAETFIDFTKEKDVVEAVQGGPMVVHMVLSMSLSQKEPLVNPLNMSEL